MAETRAKEYFYGLGRRKTAIARVRVFPGKKDFVVNGQEASVYFKPAILASEAAKPIDEAGLAGKVGVSVKVVGGGHNAQAEAVRLGIARALILYNASLKAALKHAGFLTRDPRSRERKKYGLKRARRAPQWSKR